MTTQFELIFLDRFYKDVSLRRLMFYEVIFKKDESAESAYESFLSWYKENKGRICGNPTYYTTLRKNRIIVPSFDLVSILEEVLEKNKLKSVTTKKYVPKTHWVRKMGPPERTIRSRRQSEKAGALEGVFGKK